jgi:hypothetical protein
MMRMFHWTGLVLGLQHHMFSCLHLDVPPCNGSTVFSEVSFGCFSFKDLKIVGLF